MKMEGKGRGIWDSKIGFIFAAAGSAIGLGNIWRFPYVTGQNGGAAFVLIYIFFIVIIGLPIMISELTIGRATRNHRARHSGNRRKLAGVASRSGSRSGRRGSKGSRPACSRG